MSVVLPHAGEVPSPTVEEVSPGVFAYVQLDGSWFLNNTGFVRADESWVVIDSTGTELRARVFAEAIRDVEDLPVKCLINTHHHGDHTYGNFVFGRGTVIIGHKRCREMVIAGGPPSNALFPGTDFGNCPVTPPIITFEDEIEVHAGDLKVELKYVAPAHTTSDIIAWIPERGVLYTGDIIFNGGTPFAMMGSITGWLKALEVVRALSPDVIVPGHGPVAGRVAIQPVQDYFEFIMATAQRGFDAGREPAGLATDLDLGAFAHLLDPERVVPNLHRAYSELRGEPLGTPLNARNMFREMVEYNGGRPLRCLA